MDTSTWCAADAWNEEKPSSLRSTPATRYSATVVLTFSLICFSVALPFHRSSSSDGSSDWRDRDDRLLFVSSRDFVVCV